MPRPVVWTLASVLLLTLSLTLRLLAQPAPDLKVGPTEWKLTPRPGAQTPATEPQPVTSTMSGVYSTAQAGRGEETYMNVCVACHPGGTYATPAFKTAWAGRPLSDLFETVKEKMPKNDPGSLTVQESSQVVAYLLKINDVPAGETELPADIVALKKIRIEIPGMPKDKAER